MNDDNENISNQQTEINMEEVVNITPILGTIGQYLKNKREERNLSLKTISQQTKIHIGLLEHLEKDELDKLPSKTYVRGFVKSAAKILSLNPEEALKVLEDTYKVKEPKKEQKIYHAPAQENKIHSNLNNNIFNTENLKSIFINYSLTALKFGLFITVIIVLGINLKTYISNSKDDAKNNPNIVISSLNQRPKSTPKIKKEESQNTTVKKDEPLQINLIQAGKTPGAVVESTTKKELVVNDVTLKPTAPTEKQFTVENSLSKDEMDVYLPGRFRVAPTKDIETVFVNATEGDSWITYKIDEREIKKFVLRQGRTVFMRGSNIRLFLGNTKNVKVFYKNQYINLNAKNGTKNLVFPEELKTKYLSPLFIFQKDGSAVTSDQAAKESAKETKDAKVVTPAR
jgi:cytoskeletal protein RodZ